MDGEKVAVRKRVGLRRSAALVAISLLLVPVALLTTGAAAEGPPAFSRYAVGSAGMRVAQGIALRHWGVDACQGQLDVAWGTDEASINARSYWANPRSAYDDPALNVQCRVVFNSDLDFTWAKFCTVFVHEYGHLVGRPHVADGNDVMSPIYRAPLEACATTPDPTTEALPPAVAPAVAPSTGELDAPVQRGPSRRSKPRSVRARSKAKAHVAAAARLRAWTSKEHDHS